MKAILIAPIPHLSLVDQTMHLLLSHLVENADYAEWFKLRKVAGDYLILDNSAHEFIRGEQAKTLLRQAINLKVDEIVLPDHLFEAASTVERTSEALDYICGNGYPAILSLKPRFMMVPQGRTESDFRRCLGGLLDVYHEAQTVHGVELFRKPVIGLSKDYEVWYGGLNHLIERHLYPLVEAGIIDVHCLGWGRRLWDLPNLARNFPKLRSVDSAKPFVYGRAGITLNTGAVPQYPKRPEDYFEKSLDTRQWDIAFKNAQLFQEAASGSLR